MPLYDYRCKNCAATVEAVRTIATRHESPSCQECGGDTSLAITTIVPVSETWKQNYAKLQHVPYHPEDSRSSTRVECNGVDINGGS